MKNYYVKLKKKYLHKRLSNLIFGQNLFKYNYIYLIK